ncbi:MAG TPA: hypothetical protein DEH02_20765 [Bacteroidales bacterium]|nr:MAG: hypothetical protein A2X01_07955 [Bacteroidetes bacterium GWF2_35_48]OFY95283.1 MAG: hypothetical protein A2491_03105 [Bacteroidetes bacterium RIFOXYC12_FULL_35_7]HBX53500.1 hypothetical protein [Bacteroidales bacterium]
MASTSLSHRKSSAQPPKKIRSATGKVPLSSGKICSVTRVYYGGFDSAQPPEKFRSATGKVPLRSGKICSVTRVYYGG